MNLEKLIQRQQELLDSAKAAGRELTAEEQTEFDNLQRSIEALKNSDSKEPVQQKSTETRTIDAEAIRLAERQRVSEITNMCEAFGLESREYIDGGQDVDSVRAAIMNHLMSEGAPLNQKGTADVTVVRDEADKFRAAAADALIMREGVINISNPAEGAQELRGMSLKDLAIECLARDGHNVRDLIRMSASDIFSHLESTRAFYNPAAAFPAIMDQTVRKSIVEGYNQVPTTFEAWTAKGSLPDFKESSDHEYVIGGVGEFVRVPENGEIKMDIPQTELLPTRKLDTYAKSFSMSRPAFINDDVGFATRVPALYAQKAKQTIDKNCYRILFNNPVIFDGVALFDNAHKNLISAGSKPSQTSIQAIILQQQMQTDQFGEPIYMVPRSILVPMGYEFDLAVIFGSSQVTGSGNNDINPLYNYPLQVVQSPMLNALAGSGACPWFLVADPSSAKGIQVDYLDGDSIPKVNSYVNTPGTLGMHWDIYLDWGISVRDFRGITKNPGVAL